jgi:hypothetical protein
MGLQRGLKVIGGALSAGAVVAVGVQPAAAHESDDATVGGATGCAPLVDWLVDPACAGGDVILESPPLPGLVVSSKPEDAELVGLPSLPTAPPAGPDGPDAAGPSSALAEDPDPPVHEAVVQTLIDTLAPVVAEGRLPDATVSLDPPLGGSRPDDQSAVSPTTGADHAAAPSSGSSSRTRSSPGPTPSPATDQTGAPDEASAMPGADSGGASTGSGSTGDPWADGASDGGEGTQLGLFQAQVLPQVAPPDAADVLAPPTSLAAPPPSAVGLEPSADGPLSAGRLGPAKPPSKPPAKPRQPSTDATGVAPGATSDAEREGGGDGEIVAASPAAAQDSGRHILSTGLPYLVLLTIGLVIAGLALRSATPGRHRGH